MSLLNFESSKIIIAHQIINKKYNYALDKSRYLTYCFAIVNYYLVLILYMILTTTLHVQSANRNYKE